MTETENTILQELLELEAAIKTMPTAQPKPNLLPRFERIWCFAAPFSVTGQPAISLPIGATATWLPVGIQLVAALGREDLLLQIAAELETAAPWAGRHPPV